AHTAVSTYNLAGKSLGEVDLPGLGSAFGFTGDPGDAETFYLFTSFTVPPSIYRYDLASGKSALFKQPTVDFEPSRYETTQIFYEGKDKTRIPMFLTYKKGLPLDGKNPALLTGYGGFGISLTPSFSPANLVWLELGGVLATASLRGGGEYGEAWHQAAIKTHK